jgi:cell division protease FtsH
VSYERGSTPFLGQSADAWQPRQYGEATAAAIDSQVKTFIEEALQRARALLQRNRSILEETAERLLAQETLSAAELAQVRERLIARERATDKVATVAPSAA